MNLGFIRMVIMVFQLSLFAKGFYKAILQFIYISKTVYKIYFYKQLLIKKCINYKTNHKITKK